MIREKNLLQLKNDLESTVFNKDQVHDKFKIVSRNGKSSESYSYKRSIDYLSRSIEIDNRKNLITEHTPQIAESSKQNLNKSLELCRRAQTQSKKSRFSTSIPPVFYLF